MDFNALKEKYGAHPRWAIFLEALALIGGVSFVDYLSGQEVTLSVFYAFPVILGTWFCGFWPGILLALAAVTGYQLSLAAAGVTYHASWVAGWNLFARFVYLILIIYGTRALRSHMHESAAKIKSLQGVLPICTGCKKIRDEDGYWAEIEIFLTEHSSAHAEHKLCPDCARNLYVRRGTTTLAK